MVGREALGAYVGGLGPLLGPMLAVLGRSWGLCWRSWAALGTFVGGPAPSWAKKCEEHSNLENVLISRAGARSAAWGSVLSCSWAYVVGLGPHLEPTLAVLCRSWGLCGRSWAALGAYVGGFGSLLGPMLAVLGDPKAPNAGKLRRTRSL